MVRLISIILWVGALLGVAVGTFLLIDSFLSALSAPQQGALAATGAAAAVLPYVAARAWDEITRAEAPKHRRGADDTKAAK